MKRLSSAVVWLALLAPAYAIADDMAEITVHATKPERAELLVKLGDYALDYGDISRARRLFLRAAMDRSADGARSLGQTYDPAWLTEHDLDPKQFADPPTAERWYEEALLVTAFNNGDEMPDDTKREIYKGYIGWWIKANPNPAPRP